MAPQQATMAGEACVSHLKEVTVDQEAWLKKLLYTLVKTILSLQRNRCAAADDIYYDAVHGAVNGCAVEIIQCLGLQNIYVNLSEVRRILE